MHLLVRRIPVFRACAHVVANRCCTRAVPEENGSSSGPFSGVVVQMGRSGHRPESDGEDQEQGQQKQRERLRLSVSLTRAALLYAGRDVFSEEEEHAGQGREAEHSVTEAPDLDGRAGFEEAGHKGGPKPQEEAKERTKQ